MNRLVAFAPQEYLGHIPTIDDLMTFLDEHQDVRAEVRARLLRRLAMEDDIRQYDGPAPADAGCKHCGSGSTGAASETRRKAAALMSLFGDMRQAFTSEASWETKYDIILPIADEMRALGVDPEYYDPDTTYEEDATACYEAFARRVKDWAAAFGFAFPE